MNIAIKGHPTRKEEVIQILESLGGKNSHKLFGDSPVHYYFINKYESIDKFSKYNIPDNYKCYTLEEFEEEFPFKIGDKVFHVNYTDPFDIIAFNPESVHPYTIEGVCQFNTKSCVLTKCKSKMKEKRNITLTLEKAREWYNKGGELKEIALQAFTKEELNPLPKSWEEYCKMHYTIQVKYVFASYCPQKYIALWKLEQLRNYYRQGWKPDWTNKHLDKYCIMINSNSLMVSSRAVIGAFLSFQSKEVAEEFLKNFDHLIKEAGDLI